MQQFKGKCLIRKATNEKNEKRIIICGVFIPSEPIESFHNNDEMWSAEILISDVIKCKDYQGRTKLSPEDFLTGEGQNIYDWRIVDERIKK